MVFFVMERKKTDALLQPWASSRPRLAGASRCIYNAPNPHSDSGVWAFSASRWLDTAPRHMTAVGGENTKETPQSVFLKQYFFSPVSTPAKFLICVFWGRGTETGRTDGFIWCLWNRRGLATSSAYSCRTGIVIKRLGFPVWDKAAQHQWAHNGICDGRLTHFTRCACRYWCLDWMSEIHSLPSAFTDGQLIASSFWGCEWHLCCTVTI